MVNWNYWLPWRDYPDVQVEDSSYEDEVIERCDHDFEQTTELLEPDMAQATIEDGFLVVPQMELVEEFCVKCGEPGLDGEAHPYEGRDYAYLAPYDGKWTRVAHRLAFRPDFEIDPGLSVSDALTEPEEQDDGNGRVLVNQSDESDEPFGVTD